MRARRIGRLPLRHAGRLVSLGLALGWGSAPCWAQAPAGLGPGATGADGGVEPGLAESSGGGAAGTRAVARFLLERAKQRFNRGVLERDVDELERALDALELGRSLSPDPALSFNAARVARELGRCNEARVLYQSFLAIEANAERRARAERALQELGECDPFELTAATSVLPGVGLGVSPAQRWPLRAEPPVSWATLEPSDPPRDGVPLWVWGLAGGAVVSAVSSGIFLAQAGSKDGQLEHFQGDPAAPDHAQARVEGLQAEGRAAQMRARVFGALAAGLGLGAGLGVWYSWRATEAPASELHFQAAGTAFGATWRERF